MAELDQMRGLLDIQSASINTAGAYVCLDGLYVFAIGHRLHNGHIPIVRLGGHREAAESGWQCAVREVYEEANLHIRPLSPPTTYRVDGDHIEADLQEIQWPHQIEQEPEPLLVITRRRDSEMSLSLMYLAQAEGLPTPSSEVRGLLLLTKVEIQRLCQAPLTLEQFLSQGGKAILKAKFNPRLVLEPFAQLRLLSKILSV